ncbi:uncharacterized protein [Phaseolus vulgaris]|uniref:uncharacterized protein n=1 Tax=Phaseolus vulgaris TaxID=3885 RepID=UPI0035CB1324
MADKREWKPRKIGVSIGRLTYIPTGSGELYYLRLLLNYQKGCCNYDNVKIVNGFIHKTYKEACYAIGLLADDKKFIDAIIESNDLASGNQLRRLFLTLLLMNIMSRLDEVWNKTWKLLSDDILYQKRKEFVLPEMSEMHCSLFQSLTPEQVDVYENIMTAVLSKVGASSGIASLLLLGGKLAHSTFCIPLLINEESTCNIPQGSLRAKLLIKTKLIIWDEAPMINSLRFEALDRTLRDIMRVESEENALKPFGNKVIVLGGDFRQILPVVKNGSKYDIVKATLNYSKLCKHCKILKLTENMRLKSHTSMQSQTEIKEFSDWILHIGDGDMELNELGQGMIEILEENLILDVEQPLLQLVEFVYPSYINNVTSDGSFDDGAILCPITECVDQVNEFILSLIPGSEITYLSSDSPCEPEEQENA